MKGKNVAIILGVGGALAGAILLATRAKAAELANLYGKVIDAVTGQPIAGVLVTLDGMQTYTNNGGNYAFTNLETGAYSISFEKEGYLTAVY